MLKLIIQSAKLLSGLGDSKPLTLLACTPQTKILTVRLYSSLTEGENKNANLDIEAITQGNAETHHKYQVLLLETEVMRQEGRKIPSASFLKTQHWLELLKLGSRSARLKFLEFLYKTEKKKENEQIKKEQKRLEREQQKQVNPVKESDHLVYALGHNHIFLRFYDTTINDLYNWKLLEALQFGQKLVVDCSYDRKMTTRENLNCAKQLMLLFSDNRAHEDPFDLHFCNANPQSMLMTALHQHIKTMHEPWFPLSLHEGNYTDIFPKEQLVYLTPHCKEEMKVFDHNAIYIIGGIVDKVNSEPVSFAKAREEGLRMAKFPLDRYLQWGSGSGKSLTLNQVVSVLLDVKRTGDWKFALRHVPRRKLADLDNNEQQQRNESFSVRQWKSGNWNFGYNKDKRQTDKRRLRDMRSIFNE